MPKKQNQKLKQKTRKFAKREEQMFASFSNFTLPKQADRPLPAPGVSPAVLSSLKTIKKTNNKRNIRNKRRKEQAIEKALSVEGVLEEKLAKMEKKQGDKTKAKSAW